MAFSRLPDNFSQSNVDPDPLKNVVYFSENQSGRRYHTARLVGYVVQFPPPFFLRGLDGNNGLVVQKTFHQLPDVLTDGCALQPRLWFIVLTVSKSPCCLETP